MAEEATRHEFAPAATRGLSRRQFVKAGVWAAPVVVLATAAPAAATSGKLSGGVTPGYPTTSGTQLTASVQATPRERSSPSPR